MSIFQVIDFFYNSITIEQLTYYIFSCSYGRWLLRHKKFYQTVTKPTACRNKTKKKQRNIPAIRKLRVSVNNTIVCNYMDISWAVGCSAGAWLDSWVSCTHTLVSIFMRAQAMHDRVANLPLFTHNQQGMHIQICGYIWWIAPCHT